MTIDRIPALAIGQSFPRSTQRPRKLLLDLDFPLAETLPVPSKRVEDDYRCLKAK